MPELSRPREFLERLKVASQAGYALPSDVASWLLQGIEDLESGRAKTLCGALGLHGAGQRSIRTVQQYEARNLLLTRAFTQTDGAGYGNNSARCVYLASVVRRFNRAGGRPPANAAPREVPLFETLAEIQQTGVPAPTSARRLYTLCVGR